MWCAIFPRVCAKAHILQGRFGTSSDRTCADPPVEDGSASIFCCRSSGRRGSFLRIWRVRSSIRRAGTNGLLSERLSLARRFVSRSLLSNVPTHPQDCRFFRGLPLKMSTKSQIRVLPLPRLYDGLFRVSSGRGRNGCARRSGHSCKTFLFAENTRDVRSSLVLQREIRENSELVD